MCGECESDEEETPWVLCDNTSWYHVQCTIIDQEEDVQSLVWMCPQCF